MYIFLEHYLLHYGVIFVMENKELTCTKSQLFRKIVSKNCSKYMSHKINAKLKMFYLIWSQRIKYFIMVCNT